jgi:hypothetical protein
MIKNICLILVSVTALSISGCNKSESLVSFLLLEECENEVINVLENFKNDGISDFDYKISPFTISLYSHQSINKVVEMFSSTMHEDELVMIANNPIASCYPNASFNIPLNDQFFSEKILDEYRANTSSVLKPKYSVSDGKSVTVYYDEDR